MGRKSIHPLLLLFILTIVFSVMAMLPFTSQIVLLVYTVVWNSLFTAIGMPNPLGGLDPMVKTFSLGLLVGLLFWIPIMLIMSRRR